MQNSPSPRVSPAPPPTLLKRTTPKPSSSSSLSVSSLLLRLGILWLFTSLFFCSPVLTPETSTVCYPASKYHSTLQPHVQPIIDNAKSLAHAHLSPYYVPHLHHVQSAREFITPKAQAVAQISSPYIQTVQRGWIRLYRTHVAPRVHYGRIRLDKASRPYVREIELRWRHLVKPHLEKAEHWVREVVAKVGKDERVRLARKKSAEWAGKGIDGAKKGWEGGKPLALKGWKEGRRHWKQTIVPVSVKGFRYARKHGYETGVAASTHAVFAHQHIITPFVHKLHLAYLSKVYQPYLAQHIDPVIAKVSPVVSTILQTASKIAGPVVKQVVILASPVYEKHFRSTPPPPPTLIEKFQDKLNLTLTTLESVAVSSSTSYPVVTPAVVVPAPAEEPSAELTKEQEDDEEDESFLAELEGAVDPSTVDVPKHAVVEEVDPKESEVEERERLERAKEEVKEKRAEIERDHDNWEKKVQKVGEYEEGVVIEKLVSTRSRAVSAFPAISRTWIVSIEREANKISKSLDKYFHRSTNLSLDDIEGAITKAGNRFRTKIEEISESVNGWLEDVESREEEIVQRSFEKVNAVASQATAELGMPYAWLDDVTVADWTRYHKLPQMALDWKTTYEQHSVSDTTHPALASKETDMDALVHGLREEIEEIEDGFSAKIGIIKNNAVIKAEADARALSGEEEEEEEESLFSMGSIWGDVVDSGAMILEKGKDQVLEALASAEPVVGVDSGTTTAITTTNANRSSSSSATASSSSSTSSPSKPTPAPSPVHSDDRVFAATTSAGNDDRNVVHSVLSGSDGIQFVQDVVEDVVEVVEDAVEDVVEKVEEAEQFVESKVPFIASVQSVRSEISSTVAHATQSPVAAVKEAVEGNEERIEEAVVVKAAGVVGGVLAGAI